ncbi:MAG: hypothetical protein CMM69_03675 [Rhodospirillaceae bacterium]|nr:hypothetical protein [Rhodospirillaceae bacterium]OUX29911.1 MAG: hypothetical protein CBE16_03945 [Rhodospirillaceae bacterium TMED256]
MYELSSRLNLQPDTVERSAHKLEWRGRFAKVTKAVSNLTAQAMSTSLKSVLDKENNQTIEALRMLQMKHRRRRRTIGMRGY